MSEQTTGLNWLHLLMLPIVTFVGWLALKISGKADKSEVDSSIDKLAATIRELSLQLSTHHEANTNRLDQLHRDILNVVLHREER
jgi:uncharacterized membrane-anchored protein YhcB (DUF1043 family)